ncbi:MAG: SDR family oxidoreductase [Salinibacterium sp.]|nr:SDR family oxidoreductase [Micrococcales bacterium]MBX3079255.1 SDR family oxidoreductase [Cryobacterium sp.]MCB1280700.1 SDR family oxidoreductase [Salinibacterium sp.]
MKIAVAGGTGTVGAPTVDALRAAGHEPVVLTRSNGIDLVNGDGLDAALVGVDSVIDLANISTLSPADAAAFFTAASGNLVAAASRNGVRHMVLLSIVGIDRVPHGYYAGKVAQEKVFEASPVPWTIQRATQFHEFAAQMFGQAKFGPLHIAPRARIQPIAVREVAERLTELASGSAHGHVPDLAGPREEKLDEMIRAYARSAGYRGWIPSINVPGGQMKGMRAGLVLPGPHAVLGTQTFAQWLAGR